MDVVENLNDIASMMLSDDLLYSTSKLISVLIPFLLLLVLFFNFLLLLLLFYFHFFPFHPWFVIPRFSSTTHLISTHFLVSRNLKPLIWIKSCANHRTPPKKPGAHVCSSSIIVDILMLENLICICSVLCVQIEIVQTIALFIGIAHLTALHECWSASDASIDSTNFWSSSYVVHNALFKYLIV